MQALESQPLPPGAVLGLMEWHLTFWGWKGRNFKRLAKKRELFPSGPKLFDARKQWEWILVSFSGSSADLDVPFVSGNAVNYSCKQTLFVLSLFRGKRH